ncbi:MAG: DUF1851 domain-containing protein [Methylococcaceae bacterium]|nr:DUF1851 domain-containing protein [Methylococcaceae bacterium]
MTTIAQLTCFNEFHKNVSTYKICPSEVIEKYSGILPELLIATWKETGFQNFSNGFLWSVNPDEYRNIISDFLHDYQIDDVHVIFRTAFGDMILFYKGIFYHFCIVTMRHSKLTGTLDAILEMDMAQKYFLDSIFFFNLFKKAKKNLGELTEDEVYGFFPALPLGSAILVENLQKVNLCAHLHFLSQL